MLSKELVSSTVDIYAFGCMVIKLADGRKQYKNEVRVSIHSYAWLSAMNVREYAVISHGLCKWSAYYNS